MPGHSAVQQGVAPHDLRKGRRQVQFSSVGQVVLLHEPALESLSYSLLKKVLGDALRFWYSGSSVQPISKNITNALYL